MWTFGLYLGGFMLVVAALDLAWTRWERTHRD